MQPTDSVSRNRKRRRSQVEAASMSEVNMGHQSFGKLTWKSFLVCCHTQQVHQRWQRNFLWPSGPLGGLEMGTLFDKGLQIHGRVWKRSLFWAAGGDAPFIRDAGLMTRSFSNIRKSLIQSHFFPEFVTYVLQGKHMAPSMRILIFWWLLGWPQQVKTISCLGSRGRWRPAATPLVFCVVLRVNASGLSRPLGWGPASLPS